MMRLGCLQIRISAAVLLVASLALHGVAFGQASFEGQIRGDVRRRRWRSTGRKTSNHRCFDQHLQFYPD